MKILRHATELETGTSTQVWLVDVDERQEVIVCTEQSANGKIWALVTTINIGDCHQIDPDDTTETMEELFDLCVDMGGMRGNPTPYSSVRGAIPLEIIESLINDHLNQLDETW